jgi:stringent starvation protein B
MAETSTKPYLLRALYEWCTDNGYTPYISVAVDERTFVPREYVRNGEIVLNISALATNRLRIDNNMIEFQARFNGTARDISVPIDNVLAIYARETGHGMAFELTKPSEGDEVEVEADGAEANDEAGEPERVAGRPALVPVGHTGEVDGLTDPEPPKPGGGRPRLTVIK